MLLLVQRLKSYLLLLFISFQAKKANLSTGVFEKLKLLKYLAIVLLRAEE
jgi:hypothetical protein